MESDHAISQNVSLKLVGRLVVTEQKCWANEQYSKKECLEISVIPESVSDKALDVFKFCWVIYINDINVCWRIYYKDDSYRLEVIQMVYGDGLWLVSVCFWFLLRAI